MDKSKCLTCEHYFYGRCKKFKVTWAEELVGCEFYKKKGVIKDGSNSKHNQ